MLLAVLVPFLYSVVNLFDKVLVSGDEDDADPGALMALSGLFAGLFAIIFGLWIFFTGQSFGDLSSMVMLVGIGALYYAAIRTYLNMLKEEESSSVTAWFQIVPVFGAIGAFVVLKEVPHWYQLVAILFLIVGGFVLSYKDGEFNKRVAFWMVIVAGLLALYDVLFASYGRDINELSAIFYLLVGKTVCGFVPLLFDSKSRQGFLIGLRTNFKVQFVSESINTIADIMLAFCILTMPIIFIQGILAIQPLFVMLGAMLFGGLIWELEEDTAGLSLYRKVGGMLLLIIGGLFLI